MDAAFILVADDDEPIRSMVGNILKQSGYQVLEACDGTHALRLAFQHAGPIHLLLTDVQMPGLNGRELSERLRKTRRDIKVLFMTGYPDAMLEADVALLRKPFTVRDLLGRVREVLATLPKKAVQQRQEDSGLGRSVA